MQTNDTMHFYDVCLESDAFARRRKFNFWRGGTRLGKFGDEIALVRSTDLPVSSPEEDDIHAVLRKAQQRVILY